MGDKYMEMIEIYEYGNGDYADSFRIRVQKQVDKVKEKYEIVRMEKHFIGGQGMKKWKHKDILVFQPSFILY